MDDIVAVKVVDKKKVEYFFLTWGRVFEPINSNKLLLAVSKNLANFGVSEIVDISLCDSLQEASLQKYFFESFFKMSQKRIPFGKKYNLWLKSIRKDILSGKEIYFAGKQKSSKNEKN